MKKIFLFLFLNAFASIGLLANNIQVSATTITAVDVPGQTATIQFNLTWDNSWRTDQYESNYDAAWVFVKYRLNTGGGWGHLHVKNVPQVFGNAGYGDGVVERPSDGMGVFVYRDATNLGGPSIFAGNVTLIMDLAGTPLANSDGFDVCVEAIEMVYVPTGAFYLGDESSEYRLSDATNYNSPLVLNSENVLTLGGTSAGNMGGGISFDDFDSGQERTLPAAFPKGYNHFYCMKYEISQGQFTEFLNKTGYIWNPTPPLELNTITGAPNWVCSIPDRACNFLSFLDGLQYSDWAGLRPMTEMEFEKACRGTKNPVMGEFAWGTSSVLYATLQLNLAGTSDETVANVPIDQYQGIANMTQNTLLRCGAIAASYAAPVSRANAGATYYGIMEMSGNLSEIVVGISNPAQRLFDGSHGDGNIDGGPIGWASLRLPVNGYTKSIKGGDFTSVFYGISTRYYPDENSNRNVSSGFRCVRTGGL